MSRYNFDVDGVTWSVGFDPPSASYFAQYDATAGIEDVVEVAGIDVGDTPTLRDLEAALARHQVTLPPAIRADLAAQQPADLRDVVDAAKRREDDLRHALSRAADDSDVTHDELVGHRAAGVDVPTAVHALALSGDELVAAVASRLPFEVEVESDMGAQEEAGVGAYLVLGERDPAEGSIVAGVDTAFIDVESQEWFFNVNSSTTEMMSSGLSANEVEAAAYWVAARAREYGSPAALGDPIATSGHDEIAEALRVELNARGHAATLERTDSGAPYLALASGLRGARESLSIDVASGTWQYSTVSAHTFYVEDGPAVQHVATAAEWVSRRHLDSRPTAAGIAARDYPHSARAAVTPSAMPAPSRTATDVQRMRSSAHDVGR